ncbi:MAG: hypothetical protein IBX50_14520 [Marinospirillum sp.]|uniref:hypothetical protein n=1 Tax=Marinospirillum sp. TaxID=2183934 RepID=UPI0019F10C4B|nr:hypothetical protein [Marinospirillum sp.]MBE0507902.1 hypothetical protein [Marinospirillum sp.]
MEPTAPTESKKITSASKAIERSKKAASDYAKKESSRARDASGRFVSKNEKEDKGAEALKERKEDQRNKSLVDTIKEAAVGDNGLFAGASSDNEEIGTAAGGAFYGSAKEIGEAYSKLTDPEGVAAKAIGIVKGRMAKDGKDPAKKNDKLSESQSVIAESVYEVSKNTDGLSEIKDAIEDQTKEQKKQHKATIKGLDKAGKSSGGEGGGMLGSLAELLGGGKAGKAGGILAKGGGLLKGAAGFGGKALGALAAPIAGLIAYSSKKNELAERTDLTEEQKKTQALSTGVGAGGGALAGAAAGAAIGSIIPVFGTAIGGIIGGIAGAFGGEWLGGKAGEAIAGGGNPSGEVMGEAALSEPITEIPAWAEAAAPQNRVSASGSAAVVDSGLQVSEVKASPVTSEMVSASSAGTSGSAQRQSGKQQNQQQIIDPKAIAAELAKAIKSGGDKKTDKPVAPAMASVPVDFDDTLMTLISHDRI